MTQYINKEKVVSIIKERRDAALLKQKNLQKIGDESILNEMIAFNLGKVLDDINDLETKEIIDCDDATLDFEEYGIDPDSQYAKVVAEAINGGIYNNSIKGKSYESKNKENGRSC